MDQFEMNEPQELTSKTVLLVRRAWPAGGHGFLSALQPWGSHAFLPAFATAGLTTLMKLLSNDVAILVFGMKNNETQTKINENAGKKGD